jgi:hypothetical protein
MLGSGREGCSPSASANENFTIFYNIPSVFAYVQILSEWLPRYVSPKILVHKAMTTYATISLLLLLHINSITFNTKLAVYTKRTRFIPQFHNLLMLHINSMGLISALLYTQINKIKNYIPVYRRKYLITLKYDTN